MTNADSIRLCLIAGLTSSPRRAADRLDPADSGSEDRAHGDATLRHHRRARGKRLPLRAATGRPARCGRGPDAGNVAPRLAEPAKASRPRGRRGCGCCELRPMYGPTNCGGRSFGRKRWRASRPALARCRPTASDERENVRLALAAMDELPPRQRQVLYLVTCEELAHGEVATILEISEVGREGEPVAGAKRNAPAAEERVRRSVRPTGACNET